VTASLDPGIAHRVEEGIGAAFAAAEDLGGDAPTVLAGAKDALVDGWQLSMWFGVAIAAVALAYLVVRGPRVSDELVEDVLDADLHELGVDDTGPEAATVSL
jgi:hypothetical protein